MPHVIIVGAGFVGTATGTILKEHGNTVSYVDVNPLTKERLMSSGETIHYPHEYTLAQADFVFVSVPTPSSNGAIVTDFIDAAARDIGIAMAGVQDLRRPIIVFRSTMLPGSTERLIRIVEAASGKIEGVDFGTAYMPEYLRERHAVSDFRKPRAILLGVQPGDTLTRYALYDLFEDFESEIHFTSYAQAEFQKYVHNLFNAVKISYFNEMRLVADSLDLDPHELESMFALTVKTAEAFWHPEYGTNNFGPYGGHCLPKDMTAMLGYLRENGFDAPILEASQAVNARVHDARASMPIPHTAPTD